MSQNDYEALMRRKKEAIHKAVTFFEDAPCYDLKELNELHDLNNQLAWESDADKVTELLPNFIAKMAELKPIDGAPKRIYLWKEGNMPSFGTYTDNSDLNHNHDPEFQPYMYALTVPEDVTPKGAVVVCAGGDHGDCTMHEGYQTCRDMIALGYQCFLLLNRTNHCPYAPQEAGADAARAIQYVRKNAAKYRVNENYIAFAGFSNGGLTAEACIQYFSGTQKISSHFSDYIPDEYDNYYAGPDAVINVYGPRWKDAPFDYTNVIYPPTFFAVGRKDSALDNLRALYPDLVAHHVEVEIHTFAGVPHGQSGIPIYGVNPYPQFQLWLPLADAFLQDVFAKGIVKKKPDSLENPAYRFDAFENGKVLLNKKKNHLPAMGWNSWNAFGSGNTEKLTKEMADAMIELGLDKLGYQYLVLDDGCYKPVREDGKLANEPRKFPSGFRALSDYIHAKGLKFGMYNDIGTNLCAGASVGTCGHEETDAQSYIDWGVDFLKVDNCYYPWDNATFSDGANAKYTYSPEIRSIRLENGKDTIELSAVKDGVLRGKGAEKREDYVTGLGTFDGTGPENTPVGDMSCELVFTVNAVADSEFDLIVNYSAGAVLNKGSWLQIAVGDGETSELCYDDFLPGTGKDGEFADSPKIRIALKKGANTLRLMNHRRQENTLASYAALLEGLNKADPNHDVILSLCEWGKTQAQNWGYKVSDSWRILNDISFRVGADGNPGYGAWIAGYTTSITTQYSKAVIMDEYAGLDKGWNDPDMMVIAMNDVTETMSKTHMTMWCMMNSPLMLGFDLRRIKKGDNIHRIIANEQMIALNQDPLGIQAKRIYCSLPTDTPDKDYIRDMNRVDILAKPLADGSVAISFINVSDTDKAEGYSVDVNKIVEMIGSKMVNKEKFANASSYRIVDLWTGEESVSDGTFSVNELAACDNVTIRVYAK